MNNYTCLSLAEEINSYFKDDFEQLTFESIGDKIVVMIAYDNDAVQFEHAFNVDEVNSLQFSFHHRLENIKGDLVRAKGTILLEKKENGIRSECQSIHDFKVPDGLWDNYETPIHGRFNCAGDYIWPTGEKTNFNDL